MWGPEQQIHGFQPAKQHGSAIFAIYCLMFVSS